MIIIGNTVYSQETKSDRAIAISATNLNVVYAALENPIRVVVSGIPCEKIQVVADKGTLKPDKNGNGNYLLVVPDQKTELIKEITLTIFQVVEGGLKNELAKQVFKVKEVPKPIIYFGDKTEGQITKEELKSIEIVQVIMPNFAFEGLEYIVKKYKFTYAPTKGKPVSIEAYGLVVNPEIRNLMNNCNTGDAFIISDVYAFFPGSSDIRMPGAITLTVK